MELSYRIVDVFTERPLAGNALCVVEPPAGVIVDDARMLAIAREVNLSETTYVTRTGDAGYDVRIFTPEAELPFAGHPTLGSAWTLGPGRWTQTSAGATVTVEVTQAGAVMSQPEPTFTEVYPADALLGLGLAESAATVAFVAEIGGTRHLLVPTAASIDRLRPDIRALQLVARPVGCTTVGIFRRIDDRRIHARVFVPGSSVAEDPGTGSAAGPIGVLARRLWGTGIDVVIDQGVEMGRPCRIEVHAEPGNLRVGGAVSAVAQGIFTLPDLSG